MAAETAQVSGSLRFCEIAVASDFFIHRAIAAGKLGEVMNGVGNPYGIFFRRFSLLT
jgi:hypothetical protein